MHGGYDQFKWRGGVEGTEGGTKRSLPKSLRLPTELPVPWTRSSFDDDFILISEFSENEGPRPVQTIPSDGGGTFDKNAFSVHVMSVDYQSQGRNASFSVAEDTQLFLTEKKEKVYAYVHHFTLYDIHARGFVRPFCMCYLSHCKRKVLSSMSQLMTEFTKASRLFRFGNRIVFSRDLQRRLVNLVELRGEKAQTALHRTINDQTDKTAEHYEQVWQETKRIIRALKPHMNDPRIMHQFQELERLAESRDRSHTLPDVTMATSLPKDTSFLRTSPPRPRLRRVCSLSELDALEKRNLLDKSNKMFSPAYLHNVQQLRNLHELCEWGAKEGLNRLRSILKYFSQESIALAIEKTEAELIDPSDSLLTLGRSVVSNFLHDVDLQCAYDHVCNRPCVYQPQHSALSRKLSGESSSSCFSIESFKSCLECDDVTGSARSSDGILSPFVPSVLLHKDLHGEENWDSEYERWDSDTTSGSPSSDACMRSGSSTADTQSFNEYCVIEDQTPVHRQISEMEVSHHRLPVNPPTRKSCSLENLPSMVKRRTEPRDIEHRVRLNPSLIPFLARVRINEGHLFSGAPKERPQDVEDGSSSETREERPAVLLTKCTYKGTKTEDSSWKKVQMTRLEKVPFRCYAEEVCRPIETSPVVSRVLEFKNSFSFGIHLVFAVLTGRPVVIMAESYNERDVRHLISALWTFVPENTSHGRVVIPWRRKPLHITDLPALKLAGLCKNRHSNMLPKSVKRYVSVMDFETNCIITPPYKGILLTSIFNHRNSWPTNTSLVAFVHSVFLELASKAYVYYFAYCLSGLNVCHCKGARPCPHTSHVGDDIEVLSRLGVHFSDAKIVQYLSEVVKQQQIDFHLLNQQEPRPPSISADLCQCKQFRNLPPLDPIQ